MVDIEASSIRQVQDWSNQDQTNAFRAEDSARLAESEAERGELVRADEQLQKATNYAQLVMDASLRQEAEGFVTKATAFVESQRLKAPENREAAITRDKEWSTQQATTSQDLEAHARELAEIKRAQAVIAAGGSATDAQLAYNGLPTSLDAANAIKSAIGWASWLPLIAIVAIGGFLYVKARS